MALETLDLQAVRDRLADLQDGAQARFPTVSDMVDAATAMETRPARLPAAYVATSRETAAANRTQGVHSQRVTAQVAVLFAVAAERRDQQLRDVVETHRSAIIESLAGWTAPGARTAFDYAGFRVVRVDAGMVWCECSFVADWQLRN